MSTTPSGWYPNPHNAAEELYWDGSRWLGASRWRIVESRGQPAPAYSSTVADATVMRPAGGAWPPPSTYEPIAAAHDGYQLGMAQGAVNAPAASGAYDHPLPAGGYDPAWDTMPLTADGQPDLAFAPPGHGTPYPAPGYTQYPDAAHPPFPDAGYAPYAAGNPEAYPFPGTAHYPAPTYDESAALFAPQFPPPFAPAPVHTLSSNGYALASLLLGIGGFVLTGVPFLIGLVAGGIPDALAIVFGILGIVRSRSVGGAGGVFAIVGVVLGALALCMVPFGAGTLW